MFIIVSIDYQYMQYVKPLLIIFIKSLDQGERPLTGKLQQERKVKRMQRPQRKKQMQKRRERVLPVRQREAQDKAQGLFLRKRQRMMVNWQRVSQELNLKIQKVRNLLEERVVLKVGQLHRPGRSQKLGQRQR